MSEMTNFTENKLHKIVMTTARMVIVNQCYKWSCTKILNECNWPDIRQMVDISALKFLHSIIINKQPVNIFSQFKFNRRTKAKIVLKNILKTKFKQTNSYIVHLKNITTYLINLKNWINFL